MSAPSGDVAFLLASAYELLREAEFHLEKHGFTMGTGKDGAFLARSSELRQEMSGHVDARFRRDLERSFRRRTRLRQGGAR